MQSAPADRAVVTKVSRQEGGATLDAQLEAIDSTNVRSIYWAMHELLANGTHAWNFGFPGPVEVFHDSQISVTMTEINSQGRPFLGNAAMQIFNVVPESDGTVTVRFNVNWGSQLRVRFNFIIVN